MTPTYIRRRTFFWGIGIIILHIVASHYLGVFLTKTQSTYTSEAFLALIVVEGLYFVYRVIIYGDHPEKVLMPFMILWGLPYYLYDKKMEKIEADKTGLEEAERIISEYEKENTKLDDEFEEFLLAKKLRNRMKE
jgi:hypothetical protein